MRSLRRRKRRRRKGSSRTKYICHFDYTAASSSLGRGMQQSACVDSGPPDWSVLGVYIQQVAILPVFFHTFIPGLSRASTASLPLHFHHFNRRNAVIGSADMPVPTEPSSTNGRGNLLQPKQGIELRGGHSVSQFHSADPANHCSVSTLQALHVRCSWCPSLTPMQ